MIPIPIQIRPVKMFEENVTRAIDGQIRTVPRFSYIGLRDPEEVILDYEIQRR